jgi:hypothetical protein
VIDREVIPACSIHAKGKRTLESRCSSGPDTYEQEAVNRSFGNRLDVPGEFLPGAVLGIGLLIFIHVMGVMFQPPHASFHIVLFRMSYTRALYFAVGHAATIRGEKHLCGHPYR